MSSPEPERGTLLLVVQPDGGATAERMPEGMAAGLRFVEGVIGAPFEGLKGRFGDARWCAYVAEPDEARALDFAPNIPAMEFAHLMGWESGGLSLSGPVIFFGLDGTTEVDVPEPVLLLARNIGMI